ncbi:rhodanese-related sulfurtransferase [Buchnera aphidicola (Pemphigus obesinymphae)]|uniref:oxygen-dependent tRNA uridine(34) hydroxylase TrhO n=1 Tax=Buchnera aphidicola TaxID=9 RepID=UPI0022380618|nr:rhodanese-related sulfurtransferase [Buchnera aphidicola]MCW5196594.1 rhodanese-related sulfurtransferase [Buchnera aphidicola (Pemphigus obesinymphae)]
MPFLYNRISNHILKNRMLLDTEKRITVSFYKYCTINFPKKFRDNLYVYFSKLEILGRIIVSEEGINAQVSVPIKFYSLMKLHLKKIHLGLNNLRMNLALDNKKSFWVLRMKVRKRIVSDGLDENIKFNPKDVGIYLKAKEVNNMLNDKNIIFIDMRNPYEYEVGHFKKSISIPANTFRDQLRIIIDLFKDYKDKKIVMYCTGGIRCEKATFWMKNNGFKKMYHIDGGIIGYFHDAKKNRLPIFFEGKNFVFDARLGERVSDQVISYCHQCGLKCDSHVNCRYNLCHSLFIQCHRCSRKFHSCCSEKCLHNLISQNKNTRFLKLI